MSVQRVTLNTSSSPVPGAVSRVRLVNQSVTGPAGASGTGGDMLKADNLSGLADVATARSNLGLGTAATTAASAYATAAQGTKADTAVQPAAIADFVASTTVENIVTLTQAAYDALTPASTTLYVITG